MLDQLGHVVYSASRRIIKIAFDVGMHNTVQAGSVHNRVEADLGEEAFNELCQDDALVLEAVFYCQEELSTLAVFLHNSRKLLSSNYDENERKKRLLNHDYLILKLQPRNPNEPALYIKAEKVAGDMENPKAAIHIEVPEGLVDEDMQRRCCLHKIHCGTRMGLGDIIDVLKKEDPNYDTRNSNCWDYTLRTTERLLDLACEKAVASECGRLRWEKEHLEGNIVINHVVNTGWRVMNYVKSGFS